MILKSRQAVLSIIEQATWLSERSSRAAFRFIDATNEAFSLLEKNPEIGHHYQFTSKRLSQVRIWRISGFKEHLIFYRPYPQGVEILDVIHGKRDIRPILEELL